MKCKNCYATVEEFLKVKDDEISQLKSTIECMTETAKDASTRVIADHNEITRLKAMLSASPTTNTLTINRAEYEAMKADAERYRHMRKITADECGKPESEIDQAIDQARKI